MMKDYENQEKQRDRIEINMLVFLLLWIRISTVSIKFVPIATVVSCIRNDLDAVLHDTRCVRKYTGEELLLCTHTRTHTISTQGDRYSQEPRTRSQSGSHYDEDPRGPIEEYSDKPKESSDTEEPSGEYTSVKQEDIRYRVDDEDVGHG